MPSQVKVSISDAAVIQALNTPGGAVYEWRNDIERDILQRAFNTSPVNDPLNAVHRGGVVGVFKVSWVGDHIGSNGHIVRARIENFADHAIYVEEGRGASQKFQEFSWTQWNGEIRTVGRDRLGTRAREGQHILKKALNAVLVANGLSPVA